MPATCSWLPPWSFCQACIDNLVLSCYCCTGAKAHSSTPLPLTCLPACPPAAGSGSRSTAPPPCCPRRMRPLGTPRPATFWTSQQLTRASQLASTCCRGLPASACLPRASSLVGMVGVVGVVGDAALAVRCGAEAQPWLEASAGVQTGGAAALSSCLLQTRAGRQAPAPCCVLLAGRVGPAAKWWNASAFAGPFPATQAAQAAATQYFGAPEGVLPALPQAVVALHSPRIRFQLRAAAYAEFKQRWQVRALLPTVHVPHIQGRRAFVEPVGCGNGDDVWQSKTCSTGWGAGPTKASPAPSMAHRSQWITDSRVLTVLPQNATAGGSRRLDALAWSINKAVPASGTVQLDDATRWWAASCTAIQSVCANRTCRLCSVLVALVSVRGGYALEVEGECSTEGQMQPSHQAAHLS